MTDKCVAFAAPTFTDMQSGSTLHRENRLRNARGRNRACWNMPKRKGEKLEAQLNIRLTATMYERVEKAANGLGIFGSDLIRMMLVEKLPEYEERGRKAALQAEEGKR